MHYELWEANSLSEVDFLSRATWATAANIDPPDFLSMKAGKNSQHSPLSLRLQLSSPSIHNALSKADGRFVINLLLSTVAEEWPTPLSILFWQKSKLCNTKSVEMMKTY